MTTRQADGAQEDRAVLAFVGGLIDAASQLRLPELFSGEHPEAVYRVRERNGVSVIVLRTPGLSEDQLIKLMKYRLAQYLVVNFVDPRMIYEARMEFEPLSGVSPKDVHFIAGSAETGEILCYMTAEAAPPAPAGTTLRSQDRLLFPVEKVHGWGVFNRLRLLPDLPLGKLREMGRFVKNQRLHTLDALGARAPIELGVALFRTLAGPLRLEVDAIIGDLEEGVAKQNLDYFHVPLAIIHGTLPYEAEASYFFPRYQFCTVYPFAALSSDISEAMLERLDAIVEALSRPGKAGLLALMALKRDTRTTRSSLESPQPLTGAELPQRQLAMQTRREMLDLGDRLRTMRLFRELSVAEATVVGSFMDRLEVSKGDYIVRQGEYGDALYVIEAGEAEARIKRPDGQLLHTQLLGPGDYFGEIALLTGGERTADVVALTPMRLMRLSKEAYTRYLGQLADVEQQLTRTAMSRTSGSAHQLFMAAAEQGPTTALFGGLSAAQAAVLGQCMDRLEVSKGDYIVRQGEYGDALYVIEAGEAEARIKRPDGQLLHTQLLGPGDYFGEIALLTGGERTADVVALTPMRLMRLSKEAYTRYLGNARELELQISKTAARRAGRTLQVVQTASTGE